MTKKFLERHNGTLNYILGLIVGGYLTPIVARWLDQWFGR